MQRHKPHTLVRKCQQSGIVDNTEKKQSTIVHASGYLLGEMRASSTRLNTGSVGTCSLLLS